MGEDTIKFCFLHKSYVRGESLDCPYSYKLVQIAFDNFIIELNEEMLLSGRMSGVSHKSQNDHNSAKVTHNSFENAHNCDGLRHNRP